MQIHKISTVNITAIVFVAVLLSSLLTYSLVGAVTGETTVTEDSFRKDYSYLIYEDGGTYYAQSGESGELDYSDTNKTVVIEDSISALSSGGTVFIYEVEWNNNITISEDVMVIEQLNGTTNRYINSADTQGSPYTISTDDTNYYAQDSADSYINSWTSTNASYVGNNVMLNNSDVLFKSNTYTLTSGFDFSGKSNIKIFAEQGTILDVYSSFSGDYIFDSVLNNITIFGFEMQCNNFSGAIRGHTSSIMNNIRILNNKIEYPCYHGISMTYNTNENVFIEENIINMNGYGYDNIQLSGKNIFCLKNILLNTKAGYNAIAVNGNIDFMEISYNEIDGGASGEVAVSFDAFMNNTLRTQLSVSENRIINWTSDGLRSYTSGYSGVSSNDWLINNNYINVDRYGIYFNFVNEDSATDITVTENAAYSCEHGMSISEVDVGLKLIDNWSEENEGDGFYVEGGTNHIISRNTGLNNGQNAGFGNRAGLQLHNVIGSQITNNEMFDNQVSKTQQDGLKIGGGINYNTVMENYFSDNAANAVSGSFGTDNTVQNNKGYVTNNYGTQTCANAEDIAHGLAGTPTSVHVDSMNATYDGVGVSVGADWDSTNITMEIKWTNGTAIIDDSILVSWSAKYEP